MPDSSDILDSYLPFLPADAWREMRGTVLDLVRPYALEHPAAAVRQALSVLTGYLHWAREHGLIAHPDDPRAPELIQPYFQHRASRIRPHGAAREAATLRELYGMDKAHRRTVAPPWLPDVPYTDADIAQIRAWLHHAASTRKRLDRTAIAGLALGCGLTASEMMAARTDDLIAPDDGEVDVIVRGARARAVPALRAWAPLLAELRTGTADADWLIAPGRADRGGQTLNSIRHELGGDIRPVPRRMRNTWLVTHVNGGTPVPVLMDAAGLLDAAFLRRLSPYIHMPTPDEQRTLLRNGGTHA